MPAPDTYQLQLTETQALDVIAAVDTCREVVPDRDTRARLAALVDNLAAQLGARKAQPPISPGPWRVD